MSQFTTTNDLLADVLWRAYEQTDGSSQYADPALRYLNRAYRSLWTGGAEFMPGLPTNWWWMRSQGQIILEPLYETGTVSLTNGSDIATLSDAPSYSLQGYHLLVTSASAVYQITEHAASDVGLVLDTEYVGDDDTAAEFKAVKLDYDLPADCLKLIDPMIAHNDAGAEVCVVDMAEMWRQYPPIMAAQATPTLCAPINETSVRFNSYMDVTTRLDFFYLAKPADLTTDADSAPALPLNYRHILADMACFFVLSDKEDQRAVGIGAQAKAGIQAMVAENRKRWGDAGAGVAGQIFPRQSRNTVWLRTAGGLRLWTR
jgi:hypothetical protein